MLVSWFEDLLYFLVWISYFTYVIFCDMQDQIFSDNDAFFAWTFVNRRPLWQTLLSFCWPVLTLAICLFPVYPHQVKLLILYFCAGVLLLILCLLLCKFLVLMLCYCHFYIHWFILWDLDPHDLIDRIGLQVFSHFEVSHRLKVMLACMAD